jgi:competence protein ComEA
MKIAMAILFLPIAAIAQDEGRALMQRACTKCHSINATTRQRNSKDRWQDIVDNMISRGAELADAEADKLIDYLATHLGPRVNVNKASAGDLAKVLGVTPEAGAAVVEYRTKNGAFKSIEDLKAVPALAGKDIDSKKTDIEFGQ